MAKDVFDENRNDKNQFYYDHNDIEKNIYNCLSEHDIVDDIEAGNQQLQQEKIPLDIGVHQSNASLLKLSKSIRQLAISILFLIVAVLFNLTILAVIHERVPDHEPPLPDITFNILPKNDNALDISEYIIMFMSTSTILMASLHRYRSIVIRRLCLMLGVLYIFRAICMGVTQVPVANQQYFCSPKLNRSETITGWKMIEIIISRVAYMSLGMGLSVNGRHSFCGDYIFSGHTVILVITFLMLNEYLFTGGTAVKKCQTWFWSIIKLIYFLLVATGLVCILIARGHYMVDIVLAYIITTQVFYIYHTSCRIEILNKTNNTNTKYAIQNVWWHHLLTIIESDTIEHKIIVRNVFDIPKIPNWCHRSTTDR